MVDFGKYSEKTIFFPKSITPDWKCKIKMYDKGTFLEKNPYTIEMSSSKVSSVEGFLPLSADYLKYSLFSIIAGMDGNAENITMSDLAKLKKLYKDDEKNFKLKNLGITNVKWDGNAGKGTVEFNYREVMIVDFETAAEKNNDSRNAIRKKQDNNKYMDYDGFVQDLAFSESSGSYRAINRLGYIGRYQFGERALADIGMYEKKGDFNNDWSGTFIIPNKQGKIVRVKGLNSFLNNPAAQEIAQGKYMNKLWCYIKNQFKLTKFIGNKKFEKYCGCPITESGLIAAAHLRGAKRLSEFFTELNTTGKIKDMSPYRDKNGTSIIDYMRKFAGYDLKEITRPS